MPAAANALLDEADKKILVPAFPSIGFPCNPSILIPSTAPNPEPTPEPAPEPAPPRLLSSTLYT